MQNTTRNNSFIQESIDFSTLETECVYLKDKRMKMSYKYIKNCPLKFNEELTERGWRRFGEYFSRPECENCNECKSLKIDVANFKLSRSQKRAFKKNKNTKIVIQKPTVTKYHMDIYRKYHKYMEFRKDWKYYPLNVENYKDLYIKGYGEFGKEVLYFIDDKLVGIDLIDMLKDGISSIYFFYDPDFAKYSLGTFSILKQIELAKKLSLSWIYLGYYVEDCNSLNYKAIYKPYKTLLGSPSITENYIWD